MIGLNAKLYIGDAGTKPTVVAECVRSVSLNMEAGEADVSSRGTGGWRATEATLKDGTFEIELINDPSDAQFQAIRDAFLDGSTIAMMALDKTSGDGPDMDVSITAFGREEPLEEAITISVTAKCAVFRDWVEAGVSA